MSKTSYLGANVEVTTDSFGGWINKTNQIVYDMATVVVTVSAVAQPNTTNGAETTGNAHIQGIFSANTMSVSNALRGGSVSVPATLNVTSNAVFTSVNGTIDVTSSINLFTVDANNVVVSSNVVFDGGVTKIFLIDAANTTVNTGSFFAKSNTYLSGVNTYITSTELKSTSNTIITGSRIDIDGTTFDVTSNSIFTAASLNANVDVMTIGFSAADTLNVNAISDFNANVNIDGILTQTANAVFSGALVNITSVNTAIGDAGTDKLNVNAASDFNANVNIDGILTQTANAVFSGTEINVTGQANTASLMVRDLTATRVPFVGTAGEIVDSANLVFTTANNTLSVIGNFTTSGSANIASTFQVNGTTDLKANTDVRDDLTVHGDLFVLGVTNLATNANFTVNNAIATTSTVSGILSVTGNTVIGSAPDDIVTLNARVVNSIIPNSNNAFDIGNSTNVYRTITANNFVGNTDWTSVQNKPDPVVRVTLTGEVSGSNTVTLTDLANGTVSITTTVDPAVYAHTDTSSVANVNINNSDGTVLQDLALTFDTFGHVQAVTSASTNLDNRYPQATFKTFRVFNTDTSYTWAETGSVVAGGLTDTLTFVSGIDIDIDTDVGNSAIRIEGTSTLSSVTGRGASTASAITISNATDSTTTTTGALIVSGGVGIAKQLRVGGNTTIVGLMSVSGNTLFSDNITVAGDLIVNGTTTTINSTIVTYDDKNLELGSVSSPSDAGADGGGITLKGTTDKTFNWVNATDAWTSSEHVNLLSSKEYRINGNSVLNATTLGSGITGSSLTSVGTLTSGTWSASTIAVDKGGTGQTSYTNGQLLIGNTTGNTLTKATLTGGQNVTITNGTGSITIAAANVNLGYTTASSQGSITSSTGTDAVIPAANSTVAGLVTASTQTIAGLKTFTSTITGTLSGNASTATELATARNINGVPFDGSANITVADSTKLPLTGGTISGGVTINAGLAIQSSAPQIHLADTDNSDFYIHVNSNIFYLLNNTGSPTGFTVSQGGNLECGTVNCGTISSSGTITAAGNITAFSDARLKENVTTIDSALDKVSQMRGVYYNRIDDETKTRNIGVIAQEIEAILPEVVHNNNDDMKSVAYGNIVGILIEAIKELSEEVKTLKSKLEGNE